MSRFSSVSARLAMVVTILLTLISPFNTVSAAGLGKTPPPVNLGPNVLVFDPSMSTSQIQSAVDAISTQQVDNEMGTQRYALLFKPGTYGSAGTPLILQVGYYTEVAGLGASPNDVVINGHIDVYNRCLAPDNCIALDNFWRSVSNLTINVLGLDGCRSSGDFWAVSQAAPMRRVNIQGGNLTLMDYCTAGPQFASGGYIADSQAGTVINGSQQQFMVRDSNIGNWSNGVWNQVFSGVVGAPAPAPGGAYTTLGTSPVTRERPFLYVDGSGNYNVFIPALRLNSSGTTWAGGPAAGSALPIKNFYIASPSDKTKKLNDALSDGKNLLFSPGIYHLDATLNVKKADTLVLGLGFATLVPDKGQTALDIGDVKGVKVAGLIIDAGAKNSAVLVKVGTQHKHKDPLFANKPATDPADPTSLQDVFFRIGGATPGKATTSLLVNSDNVLLDDLWIWRADHGNGVGWTLNTADTGLIVNGDNVTAYGLFVEHFQKTEVIWNGENGRTVFFQNEMPYDAPNQSAWMNGSAYGYAAYKVGDNVQNHEAWGMGSYCFFNVDPTIHAAHGFEVPVTANVKLHQLLTVSLNYDGVIDNVVNSTGGPTPSGTNPVYVVSFP